MAAKIARLAVRPPFGLPEVRVAVGTSRLSCMRGRTARIFTSVRELSGESRLKWLPTRHATPCSPIDKIGVKQARAQSDE
jgi:hypothetical protein